MSILKPELMDVRSRQIAMFCKDKRIDREIYWAGFGFQIWLQILTHILNAKDSTTIVIDEPDIYLHPDLQHKLFNYLKSLNKQIILATHAVEIINEADHDEIIFVNKDKNTAIHINDIKGLQDVLMNIGSAQNIQLSRLAKDKRIIFFEGDDFKIIRKIARKLKLLNLATAIDVIIIPIEGISQWRKIEDAAWTFEKILETDINISAVFDRDYHCEEAIDEFRNNLLKTIDNCYILDKKEIENYLLDIEALINSINEKLILKKHPDANNTQILTRYITRLINRIAKEYKSYISGQLIAQSTKYYAKSKYDTSTIVQQSIDFLNDNWSDMNFKLSMLPGKQTLSRINEKLQSDYKISLTYSIIIKHLNTDNLPTKFIGFLKELDEFCTN